VNVQHPRFPLFDSLRAIAALSVVGFHVAFFSGHFTGNSLSRWLTQLDVGVAIFFVISGFLLYRPFAQARFSGSSPPGVVPYAIRRVFRIVPAFWLALIGIGLWLGVDAVFEPRGILYFGFLEVFDNTAIVGADGIGQIWTLCVEVTFYLLLPVWALALRRVPFRDTRGFVLTEGAVLAGAVAVALAWRGLTTDFAPDGTVQLGTALLVLPAYLDHFAIGMGLAVASVVIAPDTPMPGRALAWPLALAAFVALGLAANVDGLAGNVLRHELKGLVAFGLLIPAIWAVERSLSSRVLAWRPLLWAGLVSYGLYLWNPAVLKKMADAGWVDTLSLPGYAIAGLAGSLAVAAASWYGVERWALAFARRVTRRPTTEPALPADMARETATSPR
jgi:peptidoglycan/LPS O-acetylase OafA/YrhL